MRDYLVEHYQMNDIGELAFLEELHRARERNVMCSCFVQDKS